MKFSELFIQSSFLYSGLIYLIPTIGIIGSKKLRQLYGIEFIDCNNELMMRHRAVLFGLLGSIFGIATFKKSWRRLGYLCGITSMGSYVALALFPLSQGSISSRFNEKIQKLFVLNAIGAVWLSASGLLSCVASGETDENELD